MANYHFQFTDSVTKKIEGGKIKANKLSDILDCLSQYALQLGIDPEIDTLKIQKNLRIGRPTKHPKTVLKEPKNPKVGRKINAIGIAYQQAPSWRQVSFRVSIETKESGYDRSFMSSWRFYQDVERIPPYVRQMAAELLDYKPIDSTNNKP